jgi:hypothetical protein
MKGWLLVETLLVVVVASAKATKGAFQWMTLRSLSG